MRYFQIRVPAESCLEMVLEQISESVWFKMKDHFQQNGNSAFYFSRLQGGLKSAIQARVERSANCGLAEECHDDVEGGPWLDYNDKIYMLGLRDGFDSFIREISEETLKSVLNGHDTDTSSSLLLPLSEIVRHELGKYLYYNPSCHRIPFCEVRNV
jgi:hypothetical protein